MEMKTNVQAIGNRISSNVNAATFILSSCINSIHENVFKSFRFSKRQRIMEIYAKPFFSARRCVGELFLMEVFENVFLMPQLNLRYLKQQPIYSSRSFPRALFLGNIENRRNKVQYLAAKFRLHFNRKSGYL